MREGPGRTRWVMENNFQFNGFVAIVQPFMTRHAAQADTGVDATIQVIRGTNLAGSTRQQRQSCARR